MGYKVTVFEAKAIAGGMLGLAVPEFRLPREIIEQEVAYIESCGVEIQYNSPIGARHTVNDVLKEGYSAVFIAAGAMASKRIGIPGEDERLGGLYYGLNFLGDVREGRAMVLGGKTVVIGGGNVAIDVARTALRVGAEDVQIFCLESREEMPAWEKEIGEAMEEGIVLNPSWGPRQILRDKGTVTGVEFVRCLSVFDEQGRFNPRFDETLTQVVEADNIIISIGQAADLSFLSEDSQLERALWGTLVVEENTLSTNIPGIFAGGDFTTGPTYVIRAVASGRRAAIAIDKYLQGDKSRVEILDIKTAMKVDTGLAQEEELAEEKPRIRINRERPEERIRDFREVEKGLSEESACFEATRCLRCDLEREKERRPA
jgi:NADH-quinone oxidoreductase subunit F